ncbi:MAG: CapA family protein [Candidatus Krumholzibacteria bacterium]|nr:CapA family protein [Candidatus Krumholzibacteria bacterium]
MENSDTRRLRMLLIAGIWVVTAITVASATQGHRTVPVTRGRAGTDATTGAVGGLAQADSTAGRIKIRLLLAGDTMLGRLVNETIAREGPQYPVEPLVSLTQAADVFLVNLECAISPKHIRFSGARKKFYFRADPLAAQVLAYAGVDVVSLANNHALDADYEGLLDTVQILDTMGIAHAGAGANAERAAEPAIVEVRGQRIGLLSYCDHQKDFAATKKRPGISHIDVGDADTLERLAREVRSLAAGVDHVVVALHWQPNWAPRVGKRYRSLAGRLAEAGARIIWGHSPHHFQGVEWIDNTVVIYSSGDFVDDYATHAEFRNDRQLLFEISLTDSAQTVRAYPIELELARTKPAGDREAQWIQTRFVAMCENVGSRVERRGKWLYVYRP